MNENAKKQYLSLSSLKQRGWTESIIKNMSLTPDKEKVNPHYKCTSPMKLYDLGKIEALEKTEKFMLLFEKSQKRKKSASRAVETKMQKMRDYIHSIEIELPECEKEIIYSKAIEHYNEYHFPCKYIDSHKSVDKETLIRITSNMIRHTMTDYDEIINENYGIVGVDYAHDYLKEKINKLVREKYF